MKLYLREINENDKKELLDMIQEINSSNDQEKFEGLNIKKVNSDNFDDFLIELKNNKNMKLYKPHLVNQTTYILVDNNNHIYGGTIIRHELNDNLLRHGGNIGYLIRPSERGKGYGTLLLSLTLEKSKERGCMEECEPLSGLAFNNSNGSPACARSCLFT